MSVALLVAATRLADTLARENAALDALDVSRAVALLPEKRLALAAFAEAQTRQITQTQRQAVIAMVEHLQSLAAENRRLLERALQVQSRVIEVVVGALPRVEPAGRYGRRGGWPTPHRPPAWSLVARV